MTENRNRTGPGFWSVVALAVLLPLYPLSTGPFVRLAESGVISESTGERIVETFYAPLVFVTDHVPGTEDALSWYLELWGDPGQ